MGLQRISEPAEFISLEQAKQHLRVTFADDDAIISAYIRAAVSRLDGRDGILGRQMMPAEYLWTLPGWPGSSFCLPLPPTISVDAITHLDADGTEVTVDASVYRVSGLNQDTGAVISLGISQTWPVVLAEDWPDRVRIHYTAGYRNPDSPADHPVPDDLRLACLLMIADWYEHAGSSIVGTTAAEMPLGVATLIAPHRLYLGGGT